MVTNEKDQFVAQDRLEYTPIGANSVIRISKVEDIVIQNIEEEKSREDNAKKIAKVNYSKAVLKGTVVINNYQDKEIMLSITKDLSGTVTAQSDNGKTVVRKSHGYANPDTYIKWEVKLGANDKKKLNYEYEEILFQFPQ